MKSPKIILGLILCLAILLRLPFLGSIPQGFSPDEASQAYTAYSLLQTGKDEWGISWPIASFKSFLDYKAPLQTYLMIPSISIFGLNEFAARLPSAIFGVLAVIALYLLVIELFPPTTSHQQPRTNNLALLAAFFLAISPWHIQFSRTALEVNLTSFLFPLGLYFFLRFLKTPRTNNFALLTAICWSLSLYAYHSAKIFIPLFALSLVFLYRKQLFTSAPRTNNFALLTAFLTFLLILSPLAIDSLFGNSAKRGSDLLISNLSSESRGRLDDQGFYSPLAKINPGLPRLIHSPMFAIMSQFADNYLSYYSLPFWFTEGGRETTYSVIPGRGLLLFWMLPLVLYGLFLLFKKVKNENYDARPLLLWFILAALPAALTHEGYRPNRAGSFLVLWEIVAAFGMVSFLETKFGYRRIVISLFIFLAFTLTGFYLEDYFFNSKITYPRAISFGWRDALNEVTKIQDNYDSIMIERGTQSQAFVAFYFHIPPTDFQQESIAWEAEIKKTKINYLDQIGRYKLGKFTFEILNWPEDRNPDTLYVWQGKSLLPSDRHTIYQVITPQDEIIMEVFDFKK